MAAHVLPGGVRFPSAQPGKIQGLGARNPRRRPGRFGKGAKTSGSEAPLGADAGRARGPPADVLRCQAA